MDCHPSRAVEKKSVREFHNVGFVNRRDLFAAMRSSEVKSKLCDSRGGFFSNDFQTLHDARHDFVLDAGIKPFRILAHDNKIHVVIARFNPR